MMQTITFECEVITPMFLAGADGTTPELRAPSIKGALRFWWRAMNGHLDLAELKKVEGEIFGSTSQRSKVIIQVLEEFTEKSSEFLLPHKAGSRPLAFSVTNKDNLQNCKIKLSLLSTNKFSIEQLKNLFTLTCILGGFGKRSRRGMGSMKITNINNLPHSVSEIESMIRLVNPSFSYASRSDYPTIKQIEIGGSVKTTSQIGSATHDVKFRVDTSVNKVAYDSTIGAGKPRFASPIYISILDNGLPIITTLSTVSPKSNKIVMKLQNDLKSRIL